MNKGLSLADAFNAPALSSDEKGIASARKKKYCYYSSFCVDIIVTKLHVFC